MTIPKTPSKPEKHNSCAVIVTYHPDAEFPERLSHTTDQFDRVIIVDNSADQNSHKTLQSLQGKNIHIIFNDKNYGVSKALNQGLIWAKENNYEWMLTLDQDTTVLNGILETFSEIYSSCDDKNLAIIGSNFIDHLTGVTIESCPDDKAWKDVFTVITSGSLVSLSAAQDIGSFRDDYFIDLLDAEYSLRTNLKGYKIVVTKRPMIEHSIGTPRWHKFLWRKLITSHESPLRHYYISRNHMALIKEYKSVYPEWLYNLTRTRMKEVILVLLLEENKCKKIGLTILGIFHGLIGRMGPLQRDN